MDIGWLAQHNAEEITILSKEEASPNHPVHAGDLQRNKLSDLAQQIIIGRSCPSV